MLEVHAWVNAGCPSEKHGAQLVPRLPLPFFYRHVDVCVEFYVEFLAELFLSTFLATFPAFLLSFYQLFVAFLWTF